VKSASDNFSEKLGRPDNIDDNNNNNDYDYDDT
jgi:hypothetical protein